MIRAMIRVWGDDLKNKRQSSYCTINIFKACLMTRKWLLIEFEVFYCLPRRLLWSASERCAKVTLWPSFVYWENWENKTINVRTLYFNSMEGLFKSLSHVGGIFNSPSVLCCKWHQSNIIIILDAPLSRVPLRSTNRRLHFNQQRLAGAQRAGAGVSAGGMLFERGVACEGPGARLGSRLF